MTLRVEILEIGFYHGGMFMKRVLLGILICTLIIGGLVIRSTNLIAGYQVNGSELDVAFNQTGAIFENVTVSGWGKVNNRFISQQELLNMLWQVSTSLGLQRSQSDLQLDSEKSKDYRGARFQGKIDDNAFVEVFGQSINSLDSAGAETYITVVVTVKTQEKGSKFWTDQTKMALGKVAIPEVATVISGTLPKTISHTQKQELMERVFGYLHAEKTEDIASKEMLGWTGYSPYLEEKLKVGDEDINLNMAIRTSSGSNTTSILVGTPIIAVEY